MLPDRTARCLVLLVGVQHLACVLTHSSACLQPFSLNGAGEQLKRAYKLVTEGKFSDALRAINQVLWTIPLVVVDTRREVDELKELIGICK